MSESGNLVHALKDIANRHNKRQADVARAIGQNHVYVSRIFNGTQPNLTAAEVEKVAEALEANDNERAVLFRAYLLDRLSDVKEGADLVRVVIPGDRGYEAAPKSQKPLDPKFREAVERILELGVQNISVAKLVIQFVDTIERLRS